MTRFPAFCDSSGEANGVSEDARIWDSLKQAIAASSGFQHWQLERLPADALVQEISLDHLVRRYLRETLETLAY